MLVSFECQKTLDNLICVDEAWNLSLLAFAFQDQGRCVSYLKHTSLFSIMLNEVEIVLTFEVNCFDFESDEMIGLAFKKCSNKT